MSGGSDLDKFDNQGIDVRIKEQEEDGDDGRDD